MILDMSDKNTRPEPIISVSGLRGIVGESLTPEVAMRFACAFAGLLPPGPILVSRDGRASGKMLTDAVRCGLLAIGRDVIDADVAATPTTGVLVRQFRAAGESRSRPRTIRRSTTASSFSPPPVVSSLPTKESESYPPIGMIQSPGRRTIVWALLAIATTPSNIIGT